MKLSDFDFELPETLIAQHPLPNRTSSRLLLLNKKNGYIDHSQFSNLPSLINKNDLLVFNETKVIPARLFGKKASGGKIELLIERILNKKMALAHIKASHAPKINADLYLENNLKITVKDRRENLFKLILESGDDWLDLLEKSGHIPLPPYITRSPEKKDLERYQTVYAKTQGSVAAPTAGLHFDHTLLNQLKANGVNFCFVTLHVGAGTFQPVRVENITAHKMHSEIMEVSETACEKIKQTKKNGGRIIAVGTTSLRALESASITGEILPCKKDTDLFIYPSFKFQCIDALITNFHLPKSSLLMLVSALAGKKNIMHAYQEAIEQQYRFFSYGDAMMIY